MSSLFASRAYYAFGFLALTAGVAALTTATVSILFTYFLLCAEEYRYVPRGFLAFFTHKQHPVLMPDYPDGTGEPSSLEAAVRSGSSLMAYSTGHHGSH